MSAQLSRFTQDKKALEWGLQKSATDNAELIRSQPWSRVHLLKGSESAFYLKQLPCIQNDITLKSTLIHQHYPEHVPELTASDIERGLMLFKDHSGVQLDHNPSPTQLKSLLQTYACVQSKAMQDTELLDSLPRLELAGLVSRFLDFLNPDTANLADHPGANAHAFIGKKTARSYHQALILRADMLDDFCMIASELTNTLNHGDLRCRNAAQLDNGNVILYDWDDAIIGPAGLSLQGLFSGCSNIYTALTGNSSASSAPLDTYIESLSQGQYARETLLRRCLPASAFAGVMYTLMNYGQFHVEDKSELKSIDTTFKHRLSDLLDLCDHLSATRRSWSTLHAEDYIQNDRAYRAQDLLETYTHTRPNDTEALSWLAKAQRANENWKGLVKSYQRLLKETPDDAKLHNNLGMALLRRGDHNNALNAFKTALSLDPTLAPAQKNLDRVSGILKTLVESKFPHLAPTVCLGKDERRFTQPPADKLQLATSLFRKHGTLVIENLFSQERIQKIQKLVMEEYDQYFEEKDHEDALRIGDKRYMITLEVKGSMNSPSIYAPPMLTALLEDMLGEEFNIGGINAAVSLPGAEDQRLHKDHPALFPDQGRDFHSPPFAVSMLIPLIEMTPEMGPTRVVKGSHMLSSEKAKDQPHQTPVPPLGSCLLMDYRLTHRGMANRSQSVRPLLCIIFHRPWFKDFINYTKQDAIKITRQEYNRVPKKLKHLFRETANIY